MSIKKTFTVTLLIALVMSLILTGCTSPSTTPSSTTPAASNTTAPKAKTSATFGTAGSSGAYYVIAAAMSKEINEKSGTVNMVVQATKGAEENINMVNSKQMDFGFGTSGLVYYAYNGTGYMAEKGKKAIAAVMSMHNSTGQMLVRKDSGIKTYADLKGKKVVLGTPSASVYDMCVEILKAYGIDPKKDLTPFYLTQEEGTQKLSDGDVDATFILAGTPTAVFTDLTTSGKYTLIEADPAILNKLVENTMPYAKVKVLPAGTYPNVDTDIHTLDLRANIVCRPDLPEEVVYDFVKYTMENWDSIKEGHAVLKGLDKNTFAETPIPLHPGAEKYYREIGLIK